MPPQSNTSAHRLADVISDTMIDGLIAFDAAGSIRLYNKACERIFGYSAAEMIGQNLAALMPPPTVDRQVEVPAGAQIGARREVLASRKDGTTLPIGVAIGEGELD